MRKSEGTSRRLPIIFALIFLILLLGVGYASEHSGVGVVDAMGTPPGDCPNDYNSVVTSFIVNNGTQSINVLANPGTTFTALVSEGYNISFVLQSAPENNQGNTQNGSTWIASNLGGYEMGSCVGQEVNGTWAWSFNTNEGNGSVGPSQNLPMESNVGIAYSYYPSPSGMGYWIGTSFSNPQVSYNVIWIEQTNTVLSCQETTGVVSCIATVTGIQPGSPPFGAPSGSVNYSTNSSSSPQSGESCNLVNSNPNDYNSATSSCSFSFVPSTNSAVNVSAVYGGDYDQSTSSASLVVCCLPPQDTNTTTSTSSQTSSTSTSSQTSSTSSSSTSTTPPIITTTTTQKDDTSSTVTTTSTARSTTSRSITTTSTSDLSTSQETSSSTVSTSQTSSQQVAQQQPTAGTTTTNATSDPVSAPTASSTGQVGLGYTESIAALVISAVVIAGILSVAVRKSW